MNLKRLLSMEKMSRVPIVVLGLQDSWMQKGQQFYRHQELLGDFQGEPL